MIGGNTEILIQTIDNSKSDYDVNGKRINSYKDIASLFGWKDLLSGDSKYDYKAKIEDSTHVFLCDYEDLGTVDVEEARAIINNEIYDIKYIDDPMDLHQHLEIYLKFIGGQNK